MPRIGGIAALDDVVPTERVIATAPPLVGGGDLTADRSISVSIGTSADSVASGNDTRLTNARAWSLFTGNPANGQVPTWNGTVFTPQSPSSSGSFTITATKTASYVVGVGEYVPVDTSAGGVVLTLPANPGPAIRVGWKLVNGANTLTVVCGGTDVFTRPGSGVTVKTAVLAGQGAMAQYDSVNRVWLIQADELPLDRLDARYAAAGSGGGAVSDATTTSKGIVQLAGDLGGNAAAPVVVNGEKTTNKSTVATPVANGYIGADSAGGIPTGLLPAASVSVSGIVMLAGDLGGTSTSPTVTRRAPVGGIYTPTYSASMIPTPGTGCHMRVANCTGSLALNAPAGGGVDGQRYLIELQMTSTSARTVTLDVSYELGANVTSRSIAPAGTASVWVVIGIILRGTTWRVLAVDAGA